MSCLAALSRLRTRIWPDLSVSLMWSREGDVLEALSDQFSWHKGFSWSGGGLHS